ERPRSAVGLSVVLSSTGERRKPSAKTEITRSVRWRLKGTSARRAVSARSLQSWFRGVSCRIDLLDGPALGTGFPSVLGSYGHACGALKRKLDQQRNRQQHNQKKLGNSEIEAALSGRPH